ncbi:trypsin-like peptidase domain-containing protein [Thalassobaculum sp.]|uniref:S1C family serine protease n=1 Tax=Thalassobaculum sp. TaxID=2022740 RepID=UPI0032ECF381
MTNFTGDDGPPARFEPRTGWKLQWLVVAAILLPTMLSGCKTVRYTEPSPELVIPVATEASAIPTLTQVRYRPLGRVPYRGEFTNSKGERTQLEGYVTIVPTNRSTLRIQTFVEHISWTSQNKKGINFTVSDGRLSDFEIDDRGYPRRIYAVQSNPTATGAGGIDADLTKMLRETAFNRSEFDRIIEVVNVPIYDANLSIGSTVLAESNVEFARRFYIATMASSEFITDTEIAKYTSENLPNSLNTGNFSYRSSERIVGVAYVDGYEFLSTKGVFEITAPNVRVQHTFSILIDPYSGFSYITTDEVEKTVNGKSETVKTAVVFDLPKRFDRVIQPHPASPTLPSPPTNSRPSTSLPPAEIAPSIVRPTEPGEAGSISALYKTSIPAVATIHAGNSQGSGFFIARDLVVTNAHVVGDASRAEVELQSGRRLSADVVERGDGDLDLAVLRLNSPVDVRPLPIAKDLPEPGTPVVVIGSPLGLRGTITAGIVGAIRPTSRGVLVQVDAAINPGNSGGPVLNRAGEVVGVATSFLKKTQGLGFAVFAGHIRVPTGAGPFLVAF